MSDDERRVDRDGNVWRQKGPGWYEKEWDFWGQRDAHDDREREYQPDGYTPSGEPLYRVKPTAQTQRSAPSGDGSALVGLIFLFVGAIIAAFKVFQAPNQVITGRGKEPVIAAVLSLISFGCGGHFYLGQHKKAVLALIGCLILTPFVMPPLAAIDAYGTAVKLQRGNSVGEWEFSMGKEALPAYIVIGSLMGIILFSYSMSH